MHLVGIQKIHQK